MLKRNNKYLSWWQEYPIPMVAGHAVLLFSIFRLNSYFKNLRIRRNLENIETGFVEKWKKESTGQETKINTNEVIQLIDAIHDKLSGANMFIYPEIVNKLAKLSTKELKFAYAYFNKIYTPIYNESLTQFLKNEMSSYKYAPAISALEKNNLL